jgi:WD40 repeat protein
VTSAQFYFQDKFLLAASGDSVHVFTWALDLASLALNGGAGGAGASAEDVVRLRRLHASRSCARPACAPVRVADTGGSVQLLAAHNAFRSALVFAACSDRSVRVLDVGAPGGAPAEVLRLPDAHARPLHCLALPAASGFADVGPASFDCFLTASTDGAASDGVSGAGGSGGLVRLWDLRTNACARQLTGGHVNRAQACQAALSADMLYVAVGSEDRSCVVYDLRTAGVVAKLRGAGDAVTAVAWHPLAPTLACGSLDGGVRFYSSP